MAGLSHSQAHDIVVRAWRRVIGRDPTAREALYAQAIAFLETQYGRAAGQFAALAAQGLYNWGALERARSADGTCPPGTASGTDQGSVCFFVYPTDEDAAAAFLHTLTQTHWPTIAAMKGTPEDVAAAMRVPPAYYAGTSGTNEDRIQAYAKAIRNAITTMGASIPATAASGIGTFIAASALAAAGYFAYRRYRDRSR